MFGTVEGADFRSLLRDWLQSRQENVVMDKDRIAGSTRQIKGSVKETIGKATGDAKLQADGRADKVEGKVQNAIGGVKDAMRDVLKK
jgi:uncharacterized protein YjbJ (UPF0337 family)